MAPLEKDKSEAILTHVSQQRLTVDQDTIRERVHGPDVGRPVSVTKTSREWEQSLQDLRDLLIVDEGSERKTCDKSNAQAKLDAVEELYVEYGTRSEAVGAQQVNKVCRRQVKIDMLEAQ